MTFRNFETHISLGIFKNFLRILKNFNEFSGISKIFPKLKKNVRNFQEFWNFL
jgi:hypothetical protein